MIIRCPNCEHTRSIAENKISPTAQLATCPKCKTRFRFRSLRPVVEPEAAVFPEPRPPAKMPLHLPEFSPQETEPQPPQSTSPEYTCQENAQQENADRESAAKDDIWDAVDALHQHWQTKPDTEAPEAEAPHLTELTERVEQDLRMLHDTPPERPLRDLGAMHECSEPQEPQSRKLPDVEAPIALPEADCQDADLADNAIPWENPARNGWLRGFIATLQGVLFNGPAFFSGFKASGSLAPGYLFFLITGYVAIIASFVWTQAVAFLLPDAASTFIGRAGLPALLIFAPLALGLMLLFVTGCIRIVLRIFAPDQADFIVIYKIVSYAGAPFILSIAPFVGIPLAAAWFLVCLIIGCRNALGLSWPLAVLAPLPPALMLLFALSRHVL